MKRPTQLDVAKKAGVSRTTVSLIINDQVSGNIRISEETFQRVQAVVAELGYEPNSIAQSAIQLDRPVDSTGCGDAFQAAFTVNYFRNGNVTAALRQGATQASRALKHCGAFDQIPEKPYT